MDPKIEKARARDAIKQRLARLSEKDRHAEGRTLSREILKALPQEPATVAAYYPLQDEGDIRLVLQTLLERGFRLYLPRFESGKMVFRQATSLDALVPGEWKIPVPPQSAPLLDPMTLMYALVPARAFDRSGKRLGRGNGGYDIWIRAQRTANSKTKFWGVCLECQLLQTIPMEAHDETVEAIITARGCMNTAKNDTEATKDK
jgi:5-formyltetrahydrofolate cyclo-ligase